jgi:hypothetical protein
MVKTAVMAGLPQLASKLWHHMTPLDILSQSGNKRPAIIGGNHHGLLQCGNSFEEDEKWTAEI